MCLFILRKLPTRARWLVCLTADLGFAECQHRRGGELKLGGTRRGPIHQRLRLPGEPGQPVPRRSPPTPNPRLHPAAVAAAVGPAGAVVAVVAASQKKNVAALRAKVAAAAQRKVSVTAAAPWRLPQPDNGGTWLFRIHDRAAAASRAEALNLWVDFEPAVFMSALVGFCQHSGKSHLNLKRTPISI